MSLEVVRSRAARGGADVASVSRFADSAAGELERAAELVQALLELARPLSAPVDLWSAMRPMVVLHQALATADATAGGESEGTAVVPASVTLEPRGGAAPDVATDPMILRTALASALDAATRARTPARVTCSVQARDGGEVAAVLRCGAPARPLDDLVRSTIEDGDVRFETLPDGLMIFFRAARRE